MFRHSLGKSILVYHHIHVSTAVFLLLLHKVLLWRFGLVLKNEENRTIRKKPSMQSFYLIQYFCTNSPRLKTILGLSSILCIIIFLSSFWPVVKRKDDNLKKAHFHIFAPIFLTHIIARIDVWVLDSTLLKSAFLD